LVLGLGTDYNNGNLRANKTDWNAIQRMTDNTVGLLASAQVSLLDGVGSVSSASTSLVSGSIARTAEHILQNAKLMSDVASNDYQAVGWTYMLVGLKGVALSQKAADYFGNKNRDASAVLALPTVLPTHAFLVCNYQLSSTLRRRITMSTGSYTSTVFKAASIFFSFLKSRINKTEFTGTGSFFAYEDCILTDVGGIWTKGSSSLGLSEIDNQPNYAQAVTVGTGQIGIDCTSLSCFYKLMKTFDIRNYNVFTHNCQTQSMEALRFILDGTRPHWWNPSCDIDLLQCHDNGVYYTDGSQAPKFTPTTLATIDAELALNHALQASTEIAYSSAIGTSLVKYEPPKMSDIGSGVTSLTTRPYGLVEGVFNGDYLD